MFVVPCCSERSLVADIRNVSSGEARGVLGEEFNVKVVRKPNPLEVDLENFSPLLKIRKIDMNLTVETSGTKQCFIEDIYTVGSGQNNDATVRAEAIHFG